MPGFRHVNDVPAASTRARHVVEAEVPADALAASDTGVAIGFTGSDLLVRQVALSVPMDELHFTTTATPTRIGRGSTVTTTVTVTNHGPEPVPDASFRVDLSRALDDATRPVAITASAGRPVFTRHDADLDR